MVRCITLRQAIDCQMPDFAAELTNIYLQRGNVIALDDVSLALPSGQTTAVLGASGSGKSTLVQLIIGLLVADRGTIATLGIELRPGNHRQLRRRIGYAIQDVALLPHMKIRTNVLLPTVLNNWTEDEQNARLAELLTLVHLPESVLERYPHELSGGQQQRAGLCRALMLRPDLLLLDEPFSGLDTMTRRSIHEEFLEMRQTIPISTVLVTHDPEEAIRLAGFIVILRSGRVQQFDRVQTVLNNPANDYVRALMTGLSGAGT
jgi:osmoprotectant transport system ATP-binding protein